MVHLTVVEGYPFGSAVVGSRPSWLRPLVTDDANRHWEFVVMTCAEGFALDGRRRLRNLPHCNPPVLLGY